MLLLDILRRDLGLQKTADTDFLSADDCSVSARLVAFYIGQEDEKTRAGETTLQEAGALRHLRWIEQLLMMRLAALAGTDPDLPAAAEEDDTDRPQGDDGSESDTVFGIRLIYRKVLGASLTLGDRAVEQVHRRRHDLPQVHRLIANSEEAKSKRQSAGGMLLPDVADGDFVLAAFRMIDGRSPSPGEIEICRRHLRSGVQSREDIIKMLFSISYKRQRPDKPQQVHDGLSCSIMGTNRFLTLHEWQERARDTESLAEARAKVRRSRPYSLPAGRAARTGSSSARSPVSTRAATSSSSSWIRWSARPCSTAAPR